MLGHFILFSPPLSFLFISHSFISVLYVLCYGSHTLIAQVLWQLWSNLGSRQCDEWVARFSCCYTQHATRLSYFIKCKWFINHIIRVLTWGQSCSFLGKARSRFWVCFPVNAWTLRPITGLERNIKIYRKAIENGFGSCLWKEIHCGKIINKMSSGVRKRAQRTNQDCVRKSIKTGQSQRLCFCS